MTNRSSIPRIKRLSSSLSNQIAAGEVIERPASVVKELLENSLDAAATHVDVEIEQAGSSLIRVHDNGHGIHPDDLKLALERHATAKISSSSDLEKITSLGFRGEALPSISSIAQTRIVSKIDSAEQALSVTFDPGRGSQSISPAAHDTGTTVEVRNLFFTTPARKKFLRSERTEFLHIQEMVRRIGLSRAGFSLTLHHNGNKVLHYGSDNHDFSARVSGFMGKNFIQRSLTVDFAIENIHVWGWIGTGPLSRSSTDRQYLFLNNRMIKDRHMNHAIRLACDDDVATGRFPSYVLYLHMDPGAADINVHPTKHEVRFRRARDVHDFLYAAIRDAVSGRQIIYDDAGNVIADRINDLPELSETNRVSYPAGSGRNHKAGSRGRKVSSQGQLLNNTDDEIRILSVLWDKYILCEITDGMYLFDARLIREFLARHALESVSEESPVIARPLLVPVVLPLSEKQEAALSGITDFLNDYALEVQLLGPDKCRIKSVPNFLEAADFNLLLRDLSDIRMGNKSSEQIKELIIDVIVSHVCDIPGVSMGSDSALQLIRSLNHLNPDITQLPFTSLCVKLDESDFEKFLKDHAG